MTDSSATHLMRHWRQKRLLGSIVVLSLDVAVLVFVYTYDLAGLAGTGAPDQFCVMMSGSLGLCNTVSAIATRVALVIVGLLVLSRLRILRAPMTRLLDAIEAESRPASWLLLNAAGVVLLTMPYAIHVLGPPVDLTSGAGLLLWAMGSVLAAAGLVLWLIDPRRLLQLLDWRLGAVVSAFLLFPEVGWLFSQRLWAESTLQSMTFTTTTWLLSLIATDLQTFPADAEIVFDGFGVRVGHPCSGLTGIVFSVTVVAGYIAVMHRDLHIGRSFLMVPVVAVLSWLLNALRIAALVTTGAWVSPELAVNGFHSYAGWIAFTLVTGGMILMIDRIAWFQKGLDAGSTPLPLPIWRDPVAAKIVPFAVFLLSSLLAGAFFEPASLGYPMRMAMTSLALLAFYRCMPRGLPGLSGPAPILVGTMIAALWLSMQSGPGHTLAEAAPGLTGTALTTWIIFRLAGTAIVVPVTEELFFRGYLMRRLTLPTGYGPAVGVVASSVLFAGLHGNWVLAFAAGIAFAVLYQRSGRLIDAIAAHMVANAMIGLWAVCTDNWAVI